MKLQVSEQPVIQAASVSLCLTAIEKNVWILKEIYENLIIFYSKTISQTKNKPDKYHGDSAPTISVVEKWFIAILCGRTSTIDAE